MGREVGERFKREGTYIHIWLTHFDVCQTTTKFCKAIILQLKNKLIKKILFSPIIKYLGLFTLARLENQR